MSTAAQTPSVWRPFKTPEGPFPSEPEPRHGGRVAELFAGVGGFRLGLEHAGWTVVFSNQWEPATRRQHAFDCYARHFGQTGSLDLNEDIAAVLDRVERGDLELPPFDLVVGGFPCQDYSVAKPLRDAHGIQGKKGVLWWQIHRLLKIAEPPLVFLENVDRLLKSPARQRGRDFAIMLSSLAGLGYAAEWRVVNAADYGYPQRRRRVFIVAYRLAGTGLTPGYEVIYRTGVLAEAFPVVPPGDPDGRLFDPATLPDTPDLRLDADLVRITDEFNRGGRATPFRNAGFMAERAVWTADVVPAYEGPRLTLGDVLQPEGEVPEEYFIAEDQLEAWRHLKGAKRELRRHRDSGGEYYYTEGALPFPDPLDRPARTVLTSEGGRAPSRFKHVVRTSSGRLRRLTPVELERLNLFPDGWTETLSPNQRAFCMGNALVVGLVERVGRVLSRRFAQVPVTA